MGLPIDNPKKRCYNSGRMKIYADYAATTPLDKRVLDAMTPYLTGIFANPSSSHGFGREALRALDAARDRVAELLNAKPSEVYFTASGSEADNFAVKGFAHALGTQNCKQILISSIEHHALINTATALQREGFDVKSIPVREDGIVDVAALKELLGEPTSLVCVMTANNEVGTVQPIAEICKLAHQAGAKFFTDAVQGALYYDLDVKKTDVDMLSVSAHKFYGPKGMGALFIKKGVPMSAIIDGGEQERGLRGGTSNTAGAVGLACAWTLAATEREELFEQVKTVRDRFIAWVREEIPTAVLNGDERLRVPSNANFSFIGASGTAVLHRLDLAGIAASAGSACASGSIETSHVLRAMGLSQERTQSAVRFTFGKMNTLSDAEEIVKQLKGILKEV